MDNTEIWKRYERGVDIHNQRSLYTDTEKAYNFFEGRQWEGLQSGGEELPSFNIIQPIVEHKVASVSMNNMEIVYSSLDAGEFQKETQEVCAKLNKYAARQWELLKMDDKIWNINKEAAISGDAYLYFYDEDKCQTISNTNIYFADEQSADIQGQKYIIIEERRFVDDVKKEAKENGISKSMIDLIVGDEDLDHQTNVDDEVKSDTGRCTSLLMFEKKNGYVVFSRSVRNVVYQPEKTVKMEYYPIAGLVWSQKKNSSRGCGEVLPIVPNQIEVNKTLARRAMAVKLGAFPRLVYSEGKISNPSNIDKVGLSIAIKDAPATKVTDLINYLTPAQISPDAKNLTDELIQVTKELAGAGDAALGTINPEQASGTAIMAVRDQSLIPLNEQIQKFRQLIEDIARIWYSVWVAYNPQGLEITYEENGENIAEIIDPFILEEMNVHIKVDVSPANPFSKFAKEQAIDNLFGMGAITFEEYVDLLDDTSILPKSKLKEIIEKRQSMQLNQQEQAAQIMQQYQLLQEEHAKVPDMLARAEEEGAKRQSEEDRLSKELGDIDEDELIKGLNE